MAMDIAGTTSGADFSTSTIYSQKNHTNLQDQIKNARENEATALRTGKVDKDHWQKEPNSTGGRIDVYG